MKSPPVMILGGQGYIGSVLASYLQAASIPVRSVDAGVRGTPGPVPSQCEDYRHLTAGQLEEFGSVVLLAGHSSVGACERAPVEAFANNVAGFVDLVDKLRGQKLVFASSISVYVNTGGRQASETDPIPPAVSSYDFHKQTIERYAVLAYPNGFALRLGTVSGPSPNMRDELLLNSLVRSAVQKGEVCVANRGAHRPLLGITDLCRAIECIITRPVPAGCYNVASVNTRIGEVADTVAGRFGVPCVEMECANNYDIQVSTRKFRNATGMAFRDNLEGLVDTLHDYYQRA